jgi:hypothetical protein
MIYIYTRIEVQKVRLKTFIVTNQNVKDNKNRHQNRHKNKRILRNDRKDRNITPNLTVKNNIE